MQRKKVTISRISEVSGLSTATISRALNGKGNVKPETEQYIMDVIAQLERENNIETPLISNRKNSIILLVAEFDSPVLNDFSSGLQKVAMNNGYHTIALDYTKHRVDLLKEINYLTKNIAISGIVMLNNYENNTELESLCSRFPIVNAFSTPDSSLMSSITIDDYQAGKTLANHILSIGCKKICLLCINDMFSFSKVRKMAIIDTFTNAGIELPQENIIELPGFDLDVAANMVHNLLVSSELPDAIIGINDALAATAMGEIKKLGYNIPNDIVVAGFDNASTSTLVEPNLTTINLRPYNLGTQAANILINELNHPNTPVQNIVLQGELIVRGSTLKNH